MCPRTTIRSLIVSAMSMLAPGSARASFLHGDALDALANGLAIFILFFIFVAGQIGTAADLAAKTFF